MTVWRGDDPTALGEAAQRLAAGGLVGFPTETVYGLGARADDDAAVAGIFAAKGRPADHPLIVHVQDEAAAMHFAAAMGPAARRLMARFWPGPVTVIVERRSGVAAAASGGQDSIGLRCPAHPVARALLARAAALGVPGLAAPSANRFGRVSPTNAAHVANEFGPDLLILDGGPCALGIESSIVDTSRGAPMLLRPGVLTAAELAQALGEPLLAADALAPRAPGTLAAHYAPAARVRLMTPAALAAALHQPDMLPAGLAVYSRGSTGHLPVPGGVRWRQMPARAADVAHELFATLRAFDAEGLREIWVEAPPDEPAWQGVIDRLHRAAAA